MGKYAWELKENTAMFKGSLKNTYLKKKANNFLMKEMSINLLEQKMWKKGCTVIMQRQLETGS